MDIAQRQRLIPSSLYGKTQHKTLHARLAEDLRRGRSRFVRTDPGRFFLRDFLSDPEVAQQFKQEYPAPIRADQLRNFEVLGLGGAFPDVGGAETVHVMGTAALEGRPVGYVRLTQLDEPSLALVPMRVFVLVCRGDAVLARRSLGRLGDPLARKASLGIIGYVKRADWSMFSSDPFGVVEAAARSLAEQLELDPEEILELYVPNAFAMAGYLLNQVSESSERALAALVTYHCSSRIDPVVRFGASGAYYWHPIHVRINDDSNFDPWSRYILRSELLEQVAHGGSLPS